MGSKLALQEKRKRFTFLNRRRQSHDSVDHHASHANPKKQEEEGIKPKEKLIEFLCSCCFLCVCCPLAAVCCCCIKIPCRFCHKALQHVWRWASSCGTKRRVFAEYSSFSDIDSDVASGKFDMHYAKQYERTKKKKNVKNGIRTHALSDQYLKLAP
ncbi:hypothetical protein Ahy_B05g075161 isoform A [Arachis hypogaea]|uniref:Uncharacterized protein n=1 Tax=Arachis hypogaea TaxID=3818 RepID=A0A444Z0L7_ARAHY|nr:hypothetical protein Ahy_B05g075161 isoform A [Arachis hypogaea]